MSPDLERLLEALHEKLTCPPEEKAHRAATFERLVQNALARRPGSFSRLLSRPAQTADLAAQCVRRGGGSALDHEVIRHAQVEFVGGASAARGMGEHSAVGGEQGLEGTAAELQTSATRCGNGTPEPLCRFHRAPLVNGFH